MPDRTFVFIDLAGFTALTEAHGDDDAAELIDQFEDIVRAALTPDAEFVKSIGDAAMLAFTDVHPAVESTRSIFDHCLSTPAFPVPRAGAYYGPAVARSGDYIGSAVNIAARITSLARSGQLLSGEHVAREARRLAIPVTHLGNSVLRNLAEPVDLYEVHLVASECRVVDPVCRMRLDQDDAVGHLQYLGDNYWFCSLGCVERFAQTPQRFAPPV